MDSAFPPGLPRSPTGSKGNQKAQNETEMKANPSDRLGSEYLDLGNKESLRLEDTTKHKAENLAGGSVNGGVSWVKIAQERKVLKKYDLEIIEGEEGKVVEIPNEVIEKVDLLWEDYLIGKFLDTAPHVARVHAIVNRIWNQGESKQIDVHIVDDTTMKFKVQNPTMRARILKRGMWNIGSVPLVVTKWTPDELKEKPEIKSIPMWVYLKNVPMNMFSWQGLSFIVSAAGFPVRLHPETASCSNFKLAKIFVNVDLSKELPDKINFTKNGKPSLVEFIYPWLPLRCRTCGKWGHVEKACILNKKDYMENGTLKKDNVVEGSNDKEKEKESGEGNEVRVEAAKEINREDEIEEGEMVENWQDVTPEKASRNSNLKFGQVKILTPSRFSNLLEVDEKGDSIIEVESEEILSVVKEIVEENVSIIKGKEAEAIEERGIADENKGEVEGEKENKEAESQNQGIAGIPVTQEDWPDLASASKIRPSLPRRSKTMHRVVPETTGNMGKRNKNSYK